MKLESDNRQYTRMEHFDLWRTFTSFRSEKADFVTNTFERLNCAVLVIMQTIGISYREKWKQLKINQLSTQNECKKIIKKA